MLHPQVAFRSCEDCQKYVYEHETGERHVDRFGVDLLRSNTGSVAPCFRSSDLCPKKGPNERVGLSRKNQAAYEHYLECKATNSFPDDGRVKRNAALIMGIEQQVERIRQQRMMARYA